MRVTGRMYYVMDHVGTAPARRQLAGPDSFRDKNIAGKPGNRDFSSTCQYCLWSFSLQHLCVISAVTLPQIQ